MRFKYTARTQEGELQVGFVESPSREAAAGVLTGHNLYVLSLESFEAVGWFEKILLPFKKVKLKDLMIFTRQFATLLESKVPLSNSLEALHQQTKNQILKEAVYQVTGDVNAGLSLSQALERQSEFFSEFYVNMVRTAEISGRLEETMAFVANYLEKEAVWQSRIKNALIYPAFVIALFTVVAGIMVSFVFPQIRPIFEETGAELPFITTVLLGIGNFVSDWWWLIVVILVFLAVFFVNYFKSDEGKVLLNEVLFRIPVLGDLTRKIYVARFAESTSVLIKGGVPVAQAIEIAGHSVGNVVYADALRRISDGVRAGESFSRLLAAENYFFPPLISQMTAIGESTGRLDELLSRVSAFYTREVNSVLDNLIELIQPILIAVIGGLVALLFASILLPIFNLAQSF